MSDQGGDARADLISRLKAQAARIESLEAALRDIRAILDQFAPPKASD